MANTGQASAGLPEPSDTTVPDRTERRPWLGVLIATIVAGLILVFFLIPHVILYPATPDAPERPDYSVALQTQRATNDALQEEIDRLESLLGAGICRMDEDLVIPREINPAHRREGTLQPVPDEERYEPADIAPTPERARVEDETDGEASHVSLLEMLDRSTFFVFGFTHEGNLGLGTGFAVADDRIVTNHHVVAEIDPNTLHVANNAIGGAKPAQVETVSHGGDLGQRDYAILRVPGAGTLSTLSFYETPERLLPIVAAGFPGLIIRTDSRLQELARGDLTAVPAMAVTDGIITVIQESEGLSVIGHMADVSPGNSGGPLVDRCGRVVGINTYIRAASEIAARINYALAADDLGSFLADAGINVAVEDEPCAPETIVAEAPPIADPADDGSLAAPPTPDDGASHE